MNTNVSLNPGCHLTVDADTSANIVDSALSDTAVVGTLHTNDPVTGNPCVHATTTSFLFPCTMNIGGDVNATFDETNQQLIIGGSGLVGDPISLNVDFDLSAVDHSSNPGDINFRP